MEERYYYLNSVYSIWSSEGILKIYEPFHYLRWNSKLGRRHNTNVPLWADTQNVLREPSCFSSWSKPSFFATSHPGARLNSGIIILMMLCLYRHKHGMSALEDVNAITAPSWK
ncbi:hypothetical protein WG66_007393 [Moniliophthora roreri]|nr:hypothetical protein WG66_007393 [Moniliophthora roreri]